MSYAVIVVGAGVNGSAAAYNCAKSGAKTLLLEKFPLPHSRGSSHGQTRIIRRSYVQPHYARMMDDAYAGWRQLESQCDCTLIKQSGMLSVCAKPSEMVQKCISALGETPHRKMGGSEIDAEYSGLLNFGENYEAVYEPSAGILYAAKALAALQKKFIEFGGEIKDGEKFVSLESDGRQVRVHSDRAVYRAKSVVLTVGAWLPDIQPDLQLNIPLKVSLINVAYWKVKAEGHHVDDKFPNLLVDDVLPSGQKYHFYSLPSTEYPGMVKLALHSGPTVHPDSRDSPAARLQSERHLEVMSSIVRRHFPNLEDRASIVEKCLYTVTPDEDFVIDRHPRYRNVIIGSPCSGHGFKLAPVTGSLLSQLALDLPPSHDLTPFRLDRFNKNMSKL